MDKETKEQVREDLEDLESWMTTAKRRIKNYHNKTDSLMCDISDCSYCDMVSYLNEQLVYVQRAQEKLEEE